MNYQIVPGIKKQFKAESRPVITREKIISIICQHFEVSIDMLITKSRKREVVNARFFIFYFLRKFTRLSLTDIGLLFNRDHTTVIHGLQTFNDLMDTDSVIRGAEEEIFSKIAA